MDTTPPTNVFEKYYCVQNSIGHSIVQSARKNVITPTLFGLGDEIDHVFGSRWLIDEMSRLGFSISYDEVNR